MVRIKETLQGCHTQLSHRIWTKNYPLAQLFSNGVQRLILDVSLNVVLGVEGVQNLKRFFNILRVLPQAC